MQILNKYLKKYIFVVNRKFIGSVSFHFRYAVKYNEQLLLTLEEDEFSCKLRLAYKLEQVHNIMQDGQ